MPFILIHIFSVVVGFGISFIILRKLSKYAKNKIQRAFQNVSMVSFGYGVMSSLVIFLDFIANNIEINYNKLSQYIIIYIFIFPLFFSGLSFIFSIEFSIMKKIYSLKGWTILRFKLYEIICIAMFAAVMSYVPAKICLGERCLAEGYVFFLLLDSILQIDYNRLILNVLIVAFISIILIIWGKRGG